MPRQIGLTVRYHPAIALPLIAFLYPAYHRPGQRAAFTSLGLTFLLFALPLAGLWNSGVSEYPTLLGGFLPFTDGSNYYTDARRILDGSRFNVVSSGRPLFPGLLAALLALTQHNLQLTLVVLVAIVTLACFCLTHEIQRQYGVIPALTSLSVLFLFDRRFIGTTWTEHLGLALGAIAYTLLLRAIQQRQTALFLGGLLLLSLALNARAGAFLILPVLIAWGGYFFRPRTPSPDSPFRQLSWRFSGWIAFAGCIAVSLGFVLNHWVLTVVGRADLAFSNLSYTLYAQVVESTNWRQVWIDHPEVLNIEQAEAAIQRIYQLTWIEFIQNPLGIVRSSLNAILTYLNPVSPDQALGFIGTYGRTPITHLIIGLVYALSVVGLLVGFCQRQKSTQTFLPVACLGILTSLPLAPPWMDGVPSSLRIYAATMPISALLPALGMQFVLTQLGWIQPSSVAREQKRSPFSLIFAIALVGLTVGGAIATKTFSTVPQLSPLTCPDGTAAIHIRYQPHSVIHFVPDSRATHLPNLRISDFRPGVTQMVQSLATTSGRPLPLVETTQELLTIPPGQTLIDAVDLKTFQRLWVIADTDRLPQKTRAIAVCGEMRHQVLRMTSTTY
jgi:hypothetical protein